MGVCNAEAIGRQALQGVGQGSEVATGRVEDPGALQHSMSSYNSQALRRKAADGICQGSGAASERVQCAGSR